jgi:peptidoglycan/LPS O-acetylase OafA/YrhL
MPSIQLLGNCSFDIYLIHFIILLAVDCTLMPLLGDWTNSNSYNNNKNYIPNRTAAAWICYLFVILPVTLTLAYLVDE